MDDVLKKIIAHKREEIARHKIEISETVMLREAENTTHSVISMRHSLENSASGIIAEFKRRSPSKGWIRQDADVKDIVSGYMKAGAAACSILTDNVFFGGSLNDLITAREIARNSLPLLRKEFVIDPYQILQARVSGADAILLIAACLTPDECRKLAQTANRFGMEILLEIHSEKELSHLNSYVDMLGVNNRNLGTFHTDINNSFSLAQAMRQHSQNTVKSPLLVSESGISESDTINELRKVGFRGFLVGETFMKSTDPAATLSNLINEIR